MFSMFTKLFGDTKAKLRSLELSQAMIEFQLDGTIIRANKPFLDTMGYALHEIRGQHHSMFVDPAYAKSPEYAKFWETLRSGEFQAAEYKRFGKNGKEVWIQASYNPIKNRAGRPYKVLKCASDVTRQKSIVADYEGQLRAIDKSQAVIQFELDGTIITANENFLKTLGYRFDEIQGKHRSASSPTSPARPAPIAQRHHRGGLVERQGFAVVASEVKSLALQTAKATEEIAAQVAQVQSATGDAVGAIGTIGQTIKELSGISATVASATEEQNAVARDISINMQQAASAVDGIGKSMNEIAAATRAAESSTKKVKEASQSLAA